MVNNWISWKNKWQVLFCLGCILLLIGLGMVRSIAADQTLRVGIEPVFPPFEFKAPDGGLQGFDVDLMNTIGKTAELNIQYQSLPFDGIIPALQSGTLDAAVSAMTITAEREKTIDFSRPYFRAGLAIAVRTDNQRVQRLEDLKGKSIAVQIGTTGAQTAKGVAGAQIRTFDSAVLALQELRNGNVEAVINDAPVTLYAIRNSNLNGIRIAGNLLTEEFYGIPLPKNSPYREAIDRALTQLIQNGTYAQIYRKWFGSEPPPLPEPQQSANQQTKTGGLAASLTVMVAALPALLQGAIVTLQLAAVSVVLGLVGGSLLGVTRLSTFLPLRWATRAYIDFFRGTPLLVQIFMIYFGLPALTQDLGFTFTFDRRVAAILALSLNSAAYIAEIVRAGIQSIELGQTEAALSLGLGPLETMRYVIFPQAFRRMLPPLGNEFITLLKDTSLVAVIGFEELFRQGQLIVAENYRSFEIYAVVALVYLVLTLVSSQGFSYLERWMNPVK